MEQWMVMAGAILVIAIFFPPILGVVAGAAAVMLLTMVIYKILGG